MVSNTDPERGQACALIALYLAEISTLFAADSNPWGASEVRRLLDILNRGEERRFLKELTSGEVWGHMGSVFDASLTNDTADTRFMELQLLIANELESINFASSDVRNHVEPFPGWLGRNDAPAD